MPFCKWPIEFRPLQKKSGIHRYPDRALSRASVACLLFSAALLMAATVSAFTIAPANPDSGNVITFSENDPTGADYVWNFGDGNSGTGNPITHQYNSPGSYTVTLTYKAGADEFIHVVFVSQSIVISAPSPNVDADFTYSPSQPKVDEPVTFNAGATTDPAGVVNIWRWDFGDGQTGTGKIVVHTFATGSNFLVTLRVYRGADPIEFIPETFYNSASRTVPVNTLLAPRAAFTFSPQEAIVGQTIGFDASASSDPDGYIATYSWNFGDGMLSYGQQVSRSFPGPGKKSVILTVTDNNGLTDSSYGTVTVSSAGVVFDPVPWLILVLVLIVVSYLIHRRMARTGEPPPRPKIPPSVHIDGGIGMEDEPLRCLKINLRFSGGVEEHD
jgi:PKD repeat protein